MRSGQSGAAMTDAPPSHEPQSREERLAARLRENLKRRKAQARAMGGPLPAGAQDGGESGGFSGEGRESALSKPEG